MEIRERPGLLPNSEVAFELEGNAVRIREARGRGGRSRGKSIVQQLRGKATATLGTEQIMALTRGEDASRCGTYFPKRRLLAP